MRAEESAPRVRATDSDELPGAWTFEARGLSNTWQFERHVRPWNWPELVPRDAELLWGLLEDFVGFFNERYVERLEQRIPPCWPEHGALVEEITTLCFARWQAFQSDHASIGGAQYWHQYSVPGFLDRMASWIGPDRLERCRQGLHEKTPDMTPPNEQSWASRLQTIGNLDVQQRETDLEARRLNPRARSKVHFLDDKKAADGRQDGPTDDRAAR